jgi:DNA polymerase-3 subunit epsilon
MIISITYIILNKHNKSTSKVKSKEYPNAENNLNPNNNEVGKYNNKAIILDTETTGLTKFDEFIEITVALVEFDQNGKLTVIDLYTGLREPNVEIHPKAQEVHNINSEMLKNKKIDYQRIYSLFDEADFLVAHNASFDRRFIVKEFKDLKDKLWLCSMDGISWRKRGFNSKGLQTLLKEHNINTNQAHRSESDVMALIQLLNQKNRSKNTYFKQLLHNYKISLKDIDF